MVPVGSDIPKSYLDSLISQARKDGCPVRELLSQAGINLEKDVKSGFISAKKYGEFYRLIMRSTQNEWFGMFSGGHKVPLGSFRLMALTLLHCINLKQAIFRAGDFSEVCRGMRSRFLLDLEGSRAVLRLSAIRAVSQRVFKEEIGTAIPEALVTTLLTWHRFSEWLIGKEITMHEVHFTFSESSLNTPLAYTKLRNVKFDKEVNLLVIDSSFLNHPIVQNESSLAAFLCSAPYHLVTQNQAFTSYTDRVRSIINREINTAMPSAEDVSGLLNVSITTLRRQLQKEGTSFQRLKDECRCEVAYYYLQYTELNNNDIADKLGFDEPSTFFRSFKKWTGYTPGDYRQGLK